MNSLCRKELPCLFYMVLFIITEMGAKTSKFEDVHLLTLINSELCSINKYYNLKFSQLHLTRTTGNDTFETLRTNR